MEPAAHILDVVPTQTARPPSLAHLVSRPKGTRDRTRTKAAPVDLARAVLEGLGISKVDGVMMNRSARARRPLTDEARVRAFERLLAAGMTVTDLEGFALKEWGAERAECQRILTELESRWALQDRQDAPRLKGKYRRTLQLVLQSSLAAIGAGGPPAHARNALRCVEQLCRLDGVYEPEKVTIEHTVPAADEVRQALAEMQEMQALCAERGLGAPAAELPLPPPSLH